MKSIFQKARYLGMMVVFPMIQAVAFVIACLTWSSHKGIACLCFGADSLALCFSVHITFHEAVHQKWFQGRFVSRFMDSLMTLWIGLPLNGYRWHHFNHHRHNNTLDDYSCTWKKSSKGIVPQSPTEYMFGWPGQMLRSQVQMNAEEASGELPVELSQRMAREKYLILLFVSGLAVWRWPIALTYIGCVYGGWVLVALENYAQHPPIEYGVDTTTSYYDALYNVIFCKNGFHVEHHEKAALPWVDLSRASGTRSIEKPYLLAPLFSTEKSSEEKV